MFRFMALCPGTNSSVNKRAVSLSEFFLHESKWHHLVNALNLRLPLPRARDVVLFLVHTVAGNSRDAHVIHPPAVAVFLLVIVVHISTCRLTVGTAIVVDC
jgi:hypothetical protein